MIVDMKKITLVCLESDRDTALNALRELGVLHLEPAASDGNSDGSAAVASELARTESAVAALNAVEGASGDTVQAEPAALVNEVQALLKQRDAIDQRLSVLDGEKHALAPFHGVDPVQIADLAAKGVYVHLIRSTPEALPGFGQASVVQQVSGTDRDAIYAVIGVHDLPEGVQGLPLPARSESVVDAEREQQQADRAALARRLAQLKTALPRLEEALLTLEDELDVCKAREGMGSKAKLVYLKGYAPIAGTDQIRARARELGWGLVIETPSRKDNAPTLIKHPTWVKPIKPLFGFLGIVPGYRETDVAPAFLIFMSIFFAMIFGDAGYGLLLLGTVIWLWRKFPKAPADVMRLMIIFLAATTVWGVLTCNYFGVPPDALPGFLGSSLRLFHIQWLSVQDNSMSFCLFLGAVHLTIAHGWKAILLSNSPRAVSQYGWIAVAWFMFALARNLLMGAAFAPWLIALLVGGFGAVLYGTIREKAWMDLPTLPLDLISSFGDLMSYLRLFALGIAGLKVAVAFNEMAGMVGFTGFSIIGAFLILLLGHVLNMVLCAMSVLVHGVRLNALEFSMHMGQEWAGYAYQPFAGRPRKTSEIEN